MQDTHDSKPSQVQLYLAFLCGLILPCCVVSVPVLTQMLLGVAQNKTCTSRCSILVCYLLCLVNFLWKSTMICLVPSPVNACCV